LRSLDREGAPQAVVAWGLFRIPKGLKCVERREAGRGAGVHAPQAEFTFRTHCRQTRSNPDRDMRLVTVQVGQCGVIQGLEPTGRKTRFSMMCRWRRQAPNGWAPQSAIYEGLKDSWVPKSVRPSGCPNTQALQFGRPMESVRRKPIFRPSETVSVTYAHFPLPIWLDFPQRDF
jgi:hypothetical protein